MNAVEEINTAEKLITLVEELSKAKAGTVFRGQSSSKWKLQPSLFRESGVKNIKATYPLSEEHIKKEWIESQQTLDELSKSTELGILNKKITKHNYRDISLSNDESKIPLPSLMWSCVDIMRYNSELSRFISSNQNSYKSHYIRELNDRGFLDDKIWTQKETFLRMLNEDILFSIERRKPYSNELLSGGNIPESIATYDETFPQHYEIQTSALDWTHDPYIALYFAFQDFIDPSKTPKIPTREYVYVALFSYEQLKFNNASIELKEHDEIAENERVKKQRGVFTYMPKARSFHLITGDYPSLESYQPLEGKEFILKKYAIMVNQHTISCVLKELNDKSISKKSLGLDKDLADQV